MNTENKYNWKKLSVPSGAGELESLRSGDLVMLSGVLYTARDKAHERLCALAESGGELPFNPEGNFIYYVGPSPAPPGKVIGSAGPTTSYRMDPFSEKILSFGVKGLIGKGKRDDMTKSLLVKYKAVYFSSFGGAAAYLSSRIKESSVIAFEDLGPEAIFRLRVEDFPVVVINDIYGGDLYEDQIRKPS